MRVVRAAFSPLLVEILTNREGLHPVVEMELQNVRSSLTPSDPKFIIKRELKLQNEARTWIVDLMTSKNNSVVWKRFFPI